jgi:hypothetical protein
MQTLEEKQQLLAEAGRPHCRDLLSFKMIILLL